MGRLGKGKKNVLVGKGSIYSFVKMDALDKAKGAFDELSFRDIRCWTTLISGFADRGLGLKALSCYERMQQEGIFPDSVTFTCLLKACGRIGATDKGKEIHVNVRNAYLQYDCVLGTALLDMYAKCGVLPEAQKVFDDLHLRSVVSWNALIAGHAQHGDGQEALNCFDQMRREGIFPTAVTFACILKVCGALHLIERGWKLHLEIIKGGFLVNNNVLGTSLVDMYAKCGALTSAQEVFDEIPVKDVVSWTALISGYLQHGHSKEPLSCYEKMLSDGVSPNPLTLSSLLKAYGTTSAIGKGRQIHADIIMKGLLNTDHVLGNALVDMYAKCSALTDAICVLDVLPIRNVVSWTSLLAGYAEYGDHDAVFYSFSRMREDGIEPDVVTLTVVLNACSYIGLVNKGQMYFETVTSSYGMIPTLEHHICMVMTFGRAGQLDDAIAIIRNAPSSFCVPAWSALMTSCRDWGNMNLGREAFDLVIRLKVK